MSESNQTRTNLRNTLTHGNEPNGLLMALAWSAIETLAARKMVSIYVDPDHHRVGVVFHRAAIDDNRGIVEVDDEDEVDDE